MKKGWMKTVAVVVLATAVASAGGKVADPAPAPIAPIPPKISPIPLYIGLGAIAAGVSRDCICAGSERMKDLTYGGLVRIGWDFNPYFGVEARYLKSSLEKDFSTVEHYGLFLKPQYHITKQSNIYALAGYGKTTATGCALSGDLEKNGASFGVGFEYDFTSDSPEGQYSRMFDGQGDQEKGWGVWIDFQHLFNNEGVYNVKTNIVSAGITYDF